MRIKRKRKGKKDNYYLRLLKTTTTIKIEENPIIHPAALAFTTFRSTKIDVEIPSAFSITIVRL